MSSANNSKLASLQLFRGIAAIWVAFYHIEVVAHRRLDVGYLGGIFRHGHLGVDFFFVLSGFIIYYIHKTDFGRPERAPQYLLKRVFRIWPLLLILTSLKLVYMAAGGPGVPEEKFDFDIALSSLLLLPIDSANGAKPIIDVAWSLSYEMSFYLFFAVGILFSRRVFFVAGGVCLFLGLVKMLVGPGESFLIRHLFSPYIFEFAAGILVAGIIERDVPKWLGPLLLVLGVLLIAFALPHYPAAGAVLPAEKLYWAVTFAILVYGAIQTEQRLELKVPRAAVFLGDASYSIYLLHSSVQVLAVVVATKAIGLQASRSPILLSIVGCASIVAGCFLYVLVERPLQRKARTMIGRWSAR